MSKMGTAQMKRAYDDMDDMPDDVMREAMLSSYTDDELHAELDRRNQNAIDALFQPLIDEFNAVIERMFNKEGNE